MRTILVIGIGAGNPEHMTVQAIKALNRADAIFLPDKGEAKDGLLKLRRDICDRFLERKDTRFVEMRLPERDIAATPDYGANIAAWRAGVTQRYRDFLMKALTEGECGAFLVWGDPSLYDGTLGILDDLRAMDGFDIAVEVVPGITSVQALCAAHRTALNRTGESIQITTGRRLAERGWPADAENVVVMLDGRQAFRALAEKMPDAEIHWAAYAGMPEEVAVAGKLSDVADKIAERREAARAAQGWIMDSYLLRRPRGA